MRRKNIKRAVTPYSTSERDLPSNLFYATNTVSETYVYTTGDENTITLDSSTALNATDLIFPEVTVYLTSVADANRIPSSTVNMDRWKLIQWYDYTNSDDDTFQSRIYLANLDSGTYTIKTAANSDDAEENGGFDTVACRFGDQAGTSYDGGYRFLNVTIPPDATITQATIKFIKLGGGGLNIKGKISCVDEDDAATWSAGNPISGATLTTANTAFSGVPSTADPFTTPNFSGAVQEVIDRGGWEYGNALAVVIQDNGSAASNWYSPDYYDNDPTKAPEITITYTISESIIIKARQRILLAGEDRKFAE